MDIVRGVVLHIGLPLLTCAASHENDEPQRDWHPIHKYPRVIIILCNRPCEKAVLVSKVFS